MKESSIVAAEFFESIGYDGMVASSYEYADAVSRLSDLLDESFRDGQLAERIRTTSRILKALGVPDEG